MIAKFKEYFRQNRRFFFTYAAIGCVVFFVDILSYRMSLLLGARLYLAVTIAFVLALCVHFTLNKFVNFKNFDRAIHQQLRTYGVLVAFNYCLTLGTVELGVHWGLSPLMAKIVSVGLVFPIGFLSQRHLTFGAGIGATARQLRAAAVARMARTKP